MGCSLGPRGCVRDPGPAGSTPGSSAARCGSRGRVVVSSITSSSVRAISAKSRQTSMPTAVVMTVWCAAPAASQHAADVAKSGAGFHTARPTGSLGRSGASTFCTTFATSRNRSRRSDIATTTAGPGSAVNTSRTGSSLPPMPSGWISSLGAADGQRRRDLEHVRAEDPLVPRDQVVGVVLHQAGAARQPDAHDVGDPHQDRRLPVALGAEAVPLGHQPLHGQAGQLLQRPEVLEVGGEGAEAAALEERAQAELDGGAVAQGRVPVPTGQELRTTS